MLAYNDLSRLASTTIRADLAAKNIVATPLMEAFLVLLDTTPKCWESVFVGITAWIPTASPEEAASFWQSLIKVCNEDGRPYAAYPLLHVQQNNAEAMRTLWATLPADALPALREAVAANPLVHATGLTGIQADVQASSWSRVSASMEKLSPYSAHKIADHQATLHLIDQRAPHLSALQKSALADVVTAVLQEPRHKGKSKMHGVKVAIVRSHRSSTQHRLGVR